MQRVFFVLCMLLLALQSTARAEQEPQAPRAREGHVLFSPVLSLDMGASWFFEKRPQALSSPQALLRTHVFTLDVTLGGMFGFTRYGSSAFPWLLPQLGYSFSDTGPMRTDLFVAGLGVGLGNEKFVAAYTPRLVAGRSFGLSAVGIRHGLDLRFLRGILGVELSHQWVYVGDGGLQDVKLVFRVNLAMLITPLILLAMGQYN